MKITIEIHSEHISYHGNASDEIAKILADIGFSFVLKPVTKPLTDTAGLVCGLLKIEESQ